jgi:hypothetical protein
LLPFRFLSRAFWVLGQQLGHYVQVKTAYTLTMGEGKFSFEPNKINKMASTDIDLMSDKELTDLYSMLRKEDLIKILIDRHEQLRTLGEKLNLPVVSVPLPSDSEIEAAYKEWARLQYEEEALTDTDEWSFKNGFYWLQEFYKKK